MSEKVGIKKNSIYSDSLKIVRSCICFIVKLATFAAEPEARVIIVFHTKSEHMLWKGFQQLLHKKKWFWRRNSNVAIKTHYLFYTFSVRRPLFYVIKFNVLMQLSNRLGPLHKVPVDSVSSNLHRCCCSSDSRAVPWGNTRELQYSMQLISNFVHSFIWIEKKGSK